MPYLNDSAFDNGLSWVQTNGTKLHITSQEAATFAQANTTYAVGNKTVTVGAPQDGGTDGRRVQVPAITDGAVTATDTATHWALTNGTDTLVAAGPLSASQGVTSGNTFTLPAINVTLRDVTAV